MPLINATLQQSSPYTLEVNSAPGNVAVTIVAIRRDRISEAETLTNPRGDRTISNGVARLVFFVNANKGSSGTFKVSQNGVPVAEEGYTEDAKFVIDVV